MRHTSDGVCDARKNAIDKRAIGEQRAHPPMEARVVVPHLLERRLRDDDVVERRARAPAVLEQVDLVERDVRVDHEPPARSRADRRETLGAERLAVEQAALQIVADVVLDALAEDLPFPRVAIILVGRLSGAHHRRQISEPASSQAGTEYGGFK